MSAAAFDGALTGSVRLSPTPDVVRVVLAGEMDIAMSRELMDALRTAERYTSPIEVDTQAVRFVDSAVIAAFATVAYRHPGRLRFVNPSEPVRFLLDLTQLTEIVELVHDVA